MGPRDDPATARILFSSTAGHGHVLPLLPLARAFVADGHAVALATAPAWRRRAEAEGLELLPAGLDVEAAEALNAPLRDALAALPIAERRPHAFSNRFAAIEAPARVDDVRRAVASWQPDLLVHDPGDLTAPLVAAEADVPSVHHGWGRMVPLHVLEAAARVTEPLWRAAGLEPDPFGGAFRGDYVDLWPPGLDGEAPPRGTRVHPLRPASVAPPDDRSPAWLDELPARPTVYASLGTIHNALARFRTLLDALAGEAWNAVVTVGADNDPGALDPVPANVRVERFVPQAHVLPRCAAVVAHGGSGSVLGALAHGLPMLLLPSAADQFDTAAACEAAGVALVLLPEEVSATAIRDAVAGLLDDASYARRTGAVAAAIAAMPGPDEVAARLLPPA